MKSILVIIISLLSFGASSQTLFTYGSHKVSSDEFIRAFRKNNESGKVNETDVRNYLDLYTRFRLKVQDAYVLSTTAVVAGERLLDEHPGDRVERLGPLLPLGLPGHAEAAQLGLGGRLTGAEVDAAVADEVERGDPLGDPSRVVEALRQLHDAVADADAARALAHGPQEHLGRAGVAVLLQEVVLDLPHVVDAEPVGELDLVERVLEQSVLLAVVPGPRQLVLVEDAELHLVPLCRWWLGARLPS